MNDKSDPERKARRKKLRTAVKASKENRGKRERKERTAAAQSGAAPQPNPVAAEKPFAVALAGHFDKRRDELPPKQLALIQSNYWLDMLWDGLGPDQREWLAVEEDAKRDPAGQDGEALAFDLVCKRNDVDAKLAEMQLTNPGGVPSEVETKNREIDRLRKELAVINRELDNLCSGVSARSNFMGEVDGAAAEAVEHSRSRHRAKASQTEHDRYYEAYRDACVKAGLSPNMNDDDVPGRKLLNAGFHRIRWRASRTKFAPPRWSSTGNRKDKTKPDFSLIDFREISLAAKVQK